MSIFTKFWALIKKVFTAVEIKFLPEAIAVTEDINNALKSGVVGTIVSFFSSKPDSWPQELYQLALGLFPKILATELGLQALGLTPTPEAVAAFVQQAMEAYGPANLSTQSKIWTDLAAKLVSEFNAAEISNKTWADWVDTVEDMFQQIKAAASGDDQTDDGTN